MIYFENLHKTEEQMKAVGNSDEAGNSSPKRQLIFGPPEV
jgi:hypothetical protein